MVDTKQTSLVEKARLYAIERHDFVRATYGGGSYAIHLTIVDEIGKRFLNEVQKLHTKLYVVPYGVTTLQKIVARTTMTYVK
jgi:hypothetical protein